MSAAAIRALRCSALPLFFACARSQDETELSIESFNDAADLGTATHDAMRSVVVGLPVDVDLVARRHGVDKEDLGPLVWYGRQAWEQLAPSFPLPETEVEVSFKATWLRLTGHIDVLSLVGRQARLLDWKTGRKEETDYYAQLAGYAASLILGQGCESVTASVVWLRSQTVETFYFTTADATAFVERIETHSESARYRHGEHCAHCSRSHSCEALVAISRRDVAVFSELAADVEGAVQSATPAEVVSIRRRAKVLESFTESLDKAIKRRIAADGPLESGDGYALDLVEENGKREVDTLKAWPVLQARLTDEELAGCVKVSARDADDAVAKKAGRGNGASAKRQLAEELAAAGAVEQPKIKKLKEIRLSKETEK